MRASKKKINRFPDYERVEMPDVVTFGTNLFIRKDKRALKIVFPAGQIATFAPEEELRVDNELAQRTSV